MTSALIGILRNDFQRKHQELTTNRDFKPFRQEWWVQELDHVVNWIGVSQPSESDVWCHLSDFLWRLRAAEGPKKVLTDLWRRTGYHKDMLGRAIEKEEGLVQ